MFRQAKIQNLDEFFLSLSERRDRSIFFCRIEGYSDEIDTFMKRYFDEARRNGVIIDGGIQNPTPSNLSYFMEMMGDDFKFNASFLDEKLKKWLPRMSNEQRQTIVTAMMSTFQDMVHHGKNENILKNTYIKYMCWMYYKFERILNQLGAEKPPKIFYNGAVSHYELQLLNVLSRAGSDILLIETMGDSGYQQLDPTSEYSMLYTKTGLVSFPKEFSVKWIQESLGKQANRQRMYGTLPSIQNCTNAWVKTPNIKEVLTGAQGRGTDSKFFYNMFALQYGVEDKLLFSSDLFSFYRDLKSEKRAICIVNGSIPTPTPKEIGTIRRGNYASVEQMIAGLIGNIQYSANIELQRLMIKSFIDIILEESEKTGTNISRLTSKAVYLLAWLQRYQNELFCNWKMPEVAIFLLFGKCESENEALFLRMLSKLPVDVLVLQPNLSDGSSLKDPALLEIHYEESLPMEEFPTEQSQMRVSTAAYQAERDLDTLMYQDSGMFRNQQYAKAESVTLQTMYEEIAILWDQEVKYRPCFAVTGDVVTIPVLLEKISGVKDGRVDQYWADIKKLITPDTTVVRALPWLSANEVNPIKPYVTQFLQNGKLQKNKIKQHKAYQYGILRPEMQEYLLDCIQRMLDQKVVEGTYQNGTEYTVIATALNLPKDILRQIQKFDFTKKNPKIVLINTTEQVLGLEDSILVAFLNLIGFDIVFFVPTGYQCIEKYFKPQYIHEHQIGEYMYDLFAPKFSAVQGSGLSSLRKLFGRGS